MNRETSSVRVVVGSLAPSGNTKASSCSLSFLILLVGSDEESSTRAKCAFEAVSSVGNAIIEDEGGEEDLGMGLFGCAVKEKMGVPCLGRI